VLGIASGFLTGFPTGSARRLYRFLRRKRKERNDLESLLSRKLLVSLEIPAVQGKPVARAARGTCVAPSDATNTHNWD
jgi:hypothetical protein